VLYQPLPLGSEQPEDCIHPKSKKSQSEREIFIGIPAAPSKFLLKHFYIFLS
jgi:hypothetical protein